MGKENISLEFRLKNMENQKKLRNYFVEETDQWTE